MKPSSATQSSRNVTDVVADDLSSLDHDAWQALYANIDDPDTAQAVLELADAVPAIMKRYPSLVIQARRTLVHQHNEPKRKRVRRSPLGWVAFLFGRLIRVILIRPVASVLPNVERRPRQEKVVSIAAFANAKPRKVFSVKASSRVAGGGR